MSYLDSLAANFYSFVPVFIRVSIILFFLPYIGSRTVPVMFRILFALSVSLAIMPYVPQKEENLFISVFNATLFGFSVGILIRIITSAVQIASHWMSLQIGFAAANIFNPQFGELMGPITVFYEMFTIALFFSLDIHLSLVEFIVRSFDFPLRISITSNVVAFSSLMFPLALKLAAPVIVVQLLMNLGLGFLSRIMPQANVFFVGFPLLLASGIAVMWLSTPLFTMVLAKAFLNMKDALLGLLR